MGSACDLMLAKMALMLEFPTQVQLGCSTLNAKQNIPFIMALSLARLLFILRLCWSNISHNLDSLKLSKLFEMFDQHTLT